MLIDELLFCCVPVIALHFFQAIGFIFTVAHVAFTFGHANV